MDECKKYLDKYKKYLDIAYATLVSFLISFKDEWGTALGVNFQFSQLLFVTNLCT